MFLNCCFLGVFALVIPVELKLQSSSESKWTSPPMWSPGLKAWARTPPLPSKGELSLWSATTQGAIILLFSKSFMPRFTICFIIMHEWGEQSLKLTSTIEKDVNVSHGRDPVAKFQRCDVGPKLPCSSKDFLSLQCWDGEFLANCSNDKNSPLNGFTFTDVTYWIWMLFMLFWETDTLKILNSHSWYSST